MAVVPHTIQISPELKRGIGEMLVGSATFRQQFERIVTAPNLILCAHQTLELHDRSYRARSFIRRYDSGLIVVEVQIGPGSNQAEWIAHEFEHVIEQLDGLPVGRMAGKRQKGAWYSGDQMVETERARRTGQTVLSEMAVRRETRNRSQTALWGPATD